MSFDSGSGEITIEPDEDDVGDYTLEITLIHGNEEYERAMLLYVTTATIRDSVTPDEVIELEESVESDKSFDNDVLYCYVHLTHSNV